MIDDMYTISSSQLEVMNLNAVTTTSGNIHWYKPYTLNPQNITSDTQSVTSDWRASARPPAERDVGTEEGFVERTCRDRRIQIDRM